MHYIFMRYTHTKLTTLAIIALSFATTAPVFAAPLKIAPTIQAIVTSNPYVRADKDKFSLHVEIKSPATVKKTEVFVDGKVVKTCKTGVSVCELNVGPFAEDVLGEHVYSFVATGKNGMTATQWGNFWVTIGDDVPDATDILTGKPNLKLYAHNKNGVGVFELFQTKKQFYVGEKGNRLFLMRGHAQVESVVAVETLDGNEIDTTEIAGGTYSAGRLLGPFKDADVGEHSIEYTVTGKNGKELVTTLTYWVLQKGDVISAPVSNF